MPWQYACTASGTTISQKNRSFWKKIFLISHHVILLRWYVGQCLDSQSLLLNCKSKNNHSLIKIESLYHRNRDENHHFFWKTSLAFLTRTTITKENKSCLEQACHQFQWVKGWIITDLMQCDNITASWKWPSKATWGIKIWVWQRAGCIPRYQPPVDVAE